MDCGLDEKQCIISGCPRSAVQYPFESVCIQTVTGSYWVMNRKHDSYSAAADRVAVCSWSTTGQN